MTDMLADGAARSDLVPPGSPLDFPGRTVAVKSATSENLRDSWTIGYTPQVVVGVWVGNADGTSMTGGFGAAGPAGLWHDVMAAALGNQPPQIFPRPPGLVQVTVDAATGLLPTPGRPPVTDWFVAGTAPTTSAPAAPPASVAAPFIPSIEQIPVAAAHAAPVARPGPVRSAPPPKGNPGGNKPKGN